MTAGWGVTCRCGHNGDMDSFMRSASGLALVKDHYRCPSCGTEWELRRIGQAQVMDGGQIIPAPRKVIVKNLIPCITRPDRALKDCPWEEVSRSRCDYDSSIESGVRVCQDCGRRSFFRQSIGANG